MTLWSREDGKRNSNRLAAWEEPVALRLAACSDLDALERLAELDTRPLPPGPHLVAEREGRIDAALSLSSGETIADPFRPTGELVSVLRCHAGPPPVARRERAALRPRPRPRLAWT
jgi:hypothetical protein